VGHHASFFYYYPRSRVIGALQALERCNALRHGRKGWSIKRFPFSLEGETAAVSTQRACVSYSAPSAFAYEEDKPFGRSAAGADLGYVPQGFDSVGVSFDVVIPLPPDTPHPWEHEPWWEAGKPEREEEFHLDAEVAVEGAYRCLRLSSPTRGYDSYMESSRVVRRMGLDFGAATGAVLVLEYYDVENARPLTEEPAAYPDDGWRPLPDERIEDELAAFGITPGAG